MANLSDFLGGGGGFPEQRAFTASGSFTAPCTGKYLITAIGGGAAGRNDGRGGGAGGFAQKLISLAAGDVISFTVGAGGSTPGAAGGNTILTAPGVSLTANGGTTSAGGTATGGDLNVQGGHSGNVAGSGGGAVGVYGIGYGSAALNSSGGGGVGGASSSRGGGGAFGPSPVAHLGGPGLGLQASAPTFSTPFGFGRLLQPLGRGGNPEITGEAGGGGGAGGAGGLFGGGGGGGLFGGVVGVGGGGGVIIEWLAS